MDFRVPAKLPGIYLQDIDALVVADLHIGFEHFLASKGIFIPKNSTDEMIKMMKRMLKVCNPSLVIINGDVKHEFGQASSQEWDDVYRFFEAIETRSIVVKGNHDNYLIPILKKIGVPLKEKLTIGEYTFVHGHQLIAGKKKLVIAHEHPAIAIKDEYGVKYSYKCILYDEELIVLPALNPIMPGTPVNLVTKNELLSPILKTHDIDSMKVITIEPGKEVIEFPSLARIREVQSRL